MTATDEFPRFITVLRVHDRFYACAMQWNNLQERYEPDPCRVNRLRKTKTDAAIDAEVIARRQGLEVRE